MPTRGGAERPCERRERSRLPSVVTKKRRRSQLARASAQRQQLRRAERDRRRRIRRVLVTTVLALLLVAGLVTWIMLHPPGKGATASARGDYAGVVALVHDQASQQAPIAGGAR